MNMNNVNEVKNLSCGSKSKEHKLLAQEQNKILQGV